MWCCYKDIFFFFFLFKKAVLEEPTRKTSLTLELAWYSFFHADAITGGDTNITICSTLHFYSLAFLFHYNCTLSHSPWWSLTLVSSIFIRKRKIWIQRFLQESDILSNKLKFNIDINGMYFGDWFFLHSESTISPRSCPVVLCIQLKPTEEKARNNRIHSRRKR